MRIRSLERDELDVVIDWAAGEGWNPGIGDAETFWQTDPEGFVAAEVDGELAGAGSIVAYGATYGFMGLFIVRPELRHLGLGRELWHARKALLLDRLAAGSAIEMDGVFAMQPFYAAGGFAFQHRDLRFEGRGVATVPPAAVVDDVVELGDVAFAEVAAYDALHFPAPRPAFLRRWIGQPGAHSVAVRDDAGLRGFAVARPCRVGYKIGPLFADDAATADALFRALGSRLAGEALFLDVPECNPAALALAHRHDMTEVFGCARMTLGVPPRVPWSEIFGVTTFELG